MKKLIPMMSFVFGTLIYYKLVNWFISSNTETIFYETIGDFVLIFMYVVIVMPLLLVMSKYIKDHL